jgi:membrane-associated phospholipid phosphatase
MLHGAARVKEVLQSWIWRARHALPALVVLWSSLANAEPSAVSEGKQPLVWKWPKFRPAEYVATGVVGAAAVSMFVFGHSRRSPHWTGGILFDDAVRDALRVRSPRGRDRMRTLSDVAGLTSVALVLGVDSFIVPLARGNPAVAGQLLLLDAEAFAFNSLVTTAAFQYIGRARPSYADCQRDPHFDPLCNPHDTASFWSGHTAQAFTASGLSCAHHLYAKLYGGGAPDTLACAGAITISAATGTFRILGDRHHATDVLTGALVGFGFGYGMPTLLHYSRPNAEPRAFGFAIAPTAEGVALSLAGAF